MAKKAPTQKLNKENKKTIAFYGPIIIALIMFVPAYALISDAHNTKQAKKHPNIVKSVSNQNIIIQDPNDMQERAISTKMMGRDSVDAQLFNSGDTVYFYASDYNDRNVFEYGKLLYNKKLIQKRKDLIQMQNIKQK